MKILTVVGCLGKGGTQRTAQVFAEAYRELGHDSRLLALYALGPRHAELEGRIPVWDGLTEETLRQIAEWRPELIHLHSHGPQPAEVERLLDGAGGGARVIETNVFSRPSPWAARVDVSFQLSRWALWLFRMRGGDPARSVVVPNPVDCRRFAPVSPERRAAFRREHGIPEQAFVLGRVGQPAEYSWSPVLIAVFNGLAAEFPDMRLLLVGPSERTQRQAERSPFRERIAVIHELLGDAALSAAYSACDVMVHAAEGGESFGLVNAEAILCGTPVVTLSTPWASNSQCEVVGNRIGGYVVHSPEGMRRAVLDYRRDRDRSALRQSGPEHIRREYGHLQTARAALDQALNPSGGTVGGRALHRAVMRLLLDSFDRPNWKTVLWIALNRNGARKNTVRSSGYARRDAEASA